jgi:hypothetical protein
MCVITKVAISSVIVYLIKKPLSGLDYFAGGFFARGFLAATAGLTAGAALGLAGALLGLGAVVLGSTSVTGAGSKAGSVGRGNGQLVLGASIL